MTVNEGGVSRGSSAARGDERPAVLVLDDEEDVRHLLSLVLERRGYRVHATSDGSEALRLLRESPHAVALADVLMPGMGGREFVAEVARLPEASRPAVLVISALRRESVEEELGREHPYTVVSKPFELDALAREVEAAAALWRERTLPG
jgi:two-component system response regulator AtoC